MVHPCGDTYRTRLCRYCLSGSNVVSECGIGHTIVASLLLLLLLLRLLHWGLAPCCDEYERAASILVDEHVPISHVYSNGESNINVSRS